MDPQFNTRLKKHSVEVMKKRSDPDLDSVGHADSNRTHVQSVQVEEDASIASSLTQITGNSMKDGDETIVSGATNGTSNTLHSFSKAEIEDCVVAGMTEEELEVMVDL